MRKLLFIACLIIFTNITAQNIKEFQIKFETASYTISSNDTQKILTKIASLKKSKDNYYVQIIGHTDNIGDINYNYTLSNNRAKTVSDFFKNNGFLEQNIYISGKSFLNPIADNKTEKGKAQNRRVTVILSQKKEATINFAGVKLKEAAYTINTDKSETLAYPSGTKINIPENAFVDKNGNAVTGTIALKYIEYREPVDYILSNIPMDFHDGTENFHFNSAGMFKINASQNGEEVFLKNGKNITLDFKITNELPNLNFYQLNATNQWQELSKLSSNGSNFGGDDVIDSNNLEDIRYYNLCNNIACDGFEDTKKLGIKLASGTNSMKEFYTFSFEKTKNKDKDSLPIKEKSRFSRNDETIESYKRAIANNVARINGFRTRITNETPSYSLKKISDNNSELVFNINFKVRSNVQNLNFKKINWTTNTTTAISEREWNKNWNSCVISPNDNDTYTIVLKDSTGEFSINDAKMISDNLKINPSSDLYAKMNKAYEIQQKKIKKFDKYCQKFAKRNSELEKTLATLTGGINTIKKTDSIKIFTNRDYVNCFWEKSKSYMSSEEQNLSLLDWITYFDSHKTEMYTRYTNLQNSADCIALIEKRKEAIKMANENIKQTAVAITQANQLTRSLSISNLGIYNCDQIQRLQNPVEIFAAYKNENGKEIKPLFIYLLDNKFNGILKYDGYNNYSPYRFAFSPSSKNTLLAFDGNGDSYIFESDKFKLINTSGIVLQHVFVMRKIENLQNVSELKSLL